MAKTNCPFCANEIEAGISACPFCNENLVRHAPNVPVAPKGSPPGDERTVPCRFCGQPVLASANMCRFCRSMLDPHAAPSATPHGPPPGAPPPVATPYNPNVVPAEYVWDDKSRNVFARWWKTWADVHFGFDNYWSRVPWTGGHKSPITFVAFMNLQFLMLAMLCGIPIMLLVFASIASNRHGGAQAAGAGVGMVVVMCLIGIPVWFVFATLMTYVAALIDHLVCKLLGGTGDFEATLRCTALCSSANIWALIPYVGGLIAFGFMIVTKIHAFSHAHRFTKGRAAAAAILPMVVCCGTVIAAYIVFFALIFASVGAGGTIR